MNIWKLCDGADHWVVAEDEDDARGVVAEFYGYADQGIAAHIESAIQLSPEQTLKIHTEDARGSVTTLTCAEWAKDGRAYLGCSEW